MKSNQKKKSQTKPPVATQRKAAVNKITPKDIPQWVIAGVLIFTALIYIKALFNGFVDSWDDAKYLMENPFIKDFSLNGIKVIFSTFYLSNYHPLTTLTYLFEYKFYGFNPLPYHLDNVLLHLLNTWLVYKFIAQLSQKKITALVVSLLFALHPMHVESVAWVSERKDVLYTLFFLLSLIAYLAYLKSGYKKKKYFIVILYFIASLLSKSAAVTLPIILIVIDTYKKREINFKSLIEKVPLIMLSLLFGILAVLSQKSGGAIKDLSKDLALSYSFLDNIFVFTYSIAYYIVNLITPLSLSAMHYYQPLNEGALPGLYYVSLPFLILIIWLVFKGHSFRKEKFFGVLFFIISMAVTLQFYHIGIAFAAERYTYIASIGLFFIAGEWISTIKDNQFKKAVISVFSIYIIIISYQTWDRIGYWKNIETLFTDVINKNPNNYHGYWTRGIDRNCKNDFKGALSDYNKVMAFSPGKSLFSMARGTCRYKLNDFTGAIEDYNITIHIDSTIPEAFNNRGMAYEALGDLKMAFSDYNKAILLNHDMGMAFNNRGVIKAKTGDMTGALADINTAINLAPKEAKGYSDRGNIKAIQKDYKGSVEDFNTAIKFKPDDIFSFYNRGNSFFNMADTVSACKDWKKSSELGYETATAMWKKFCK